LGLLVLAIFVLGWKARKEIKSSPYTSSFLLLLIGFQAMLGMWTVTMLLKPAIVSGHLLGGMSTLAVLSWLAHRHWGYYSDSIVTCQRLRLAIRLALVLLFMQIFLGGWTSTNYAALACTDFPTCHGAWVPDMDFKDAFHMVRELGLSKDGSALSLASLTAIQWTHRVGALVSFIYLGALGLTTLKYWQLKRWSVLLLGALITQIALGISNLVLHLPLVLAVAHNFTAALLVIIVVVLNSKISGGKAN
jgi:cytochrome c oxidase assembly protein subunit 15